MDEGNELKTTKKLHAHCYKISEPRRMYRRVSCWNYRSGPASALFRPQTW